MVENIKYFINNYDFDMLMAWISKASEDPLGVMLNPWILIPVVIVVGMMAHPKTTELAQWLVSYVPAVGYLFVTGVVLSNDVISNIGPFVMAMAAFFMIIGWLIYTQLLNN